MNAQPRTGKLGAAALARLLNRYASPPDLSVLVGPGVGIDAAALSVGKGVLVVASDPITYAAEEVGRLAVLVNANDIFVCGARPRWFLADILLPPGQDRLAERIFREIHLACREVGACPVGGHTELTPDLPRPIVAGFMIGLAERRGIVTADGTRAGDAIILTKAAAIEGTAVIAREHARDLAGRMPAPLLRRARQFLRSPGISVGPEATVALRHGAHAMHDPTEGGVLGGLWEMSHCSGLAFHVEPGRIPIYPETRAICDRFGLDPLGLLASGSLLLTCPARAVRKMLSALHSAGIPASRIGSAEKGRPGVHLGGGQIMSVPGADEILKVGTSVRPSRPVPHSVVASRWQARSKHTGGTS